MNTLQLRPMSRYRREELYEEDNSELNRMMLSPNITSLGNPTFASDNNLVANAAEPAQSAPSVVAPSNNVPTRRETSNENYSISFMATSTPHDRRHFGWTRLTQFEKLQASVILMLLLIICVMVIVMISETHGPMFESEHEYEHHHHFVDVLNHSHEHVCLSDECITISSSIINALDKSVKPCDDFYRYACGGWIKNNPIPDGRSAWGTFSKLTQDNQLVLKNIIENDTNSFKGAELKAKMYYDSCMDKNGTIEKLKAKPLQDFIDLIGGWNISGGFDIRAWNLQTKLILMHNKYNRGGLFEWSVSADEKNSTKNILEVQQGSFLLPRDYYLNKTDDDEVIVAYLNYMTTIGVLLGGEEANTRRQMRDVIALERKISKLMLPLENLRDDEKTYHKIKLKDLIKLAPFIDWVTYFREAFAPVKRNIDQDELVVVYSPDYLRNLSNLIGEYSKDEHKHVALVNTLVWTVVQPLTNYLSKQFRDAGKAFSQSLYGTEGVTSKWRYCIADTGSVLGFSVGCMFVKQSFRGQAKNESELMINQIRKAFKAHLQNSEWMDKETLKLAMEKADAITDMIGFPDFILNQTKLDEKYQSLTVKEDQYFKNGIQSNIYMLNDIIKKLDNPTNKTEWDMPPPVVNAYYAPTKNQIAFPAGILQSPFYDTSRPRALNFGAMGVVMGHELTHAFDDQGREYDKKGNLHEWWQNSTILKFKEKMKCFEQQYSRYQIGKDHVNGKQTLGENVADFGGLSSAFHAYTQLEKDVHKDIQLPGLHFTPNQLFFVGFAQVWCSANTPEALKLQIRSDPHTPSEFRVIGTLSNSKDFADAFKCPLGSAMNPLNKCSVW